MRWKAEEFKKCALELDAMLVHILKWSTLPQHLGCPEGPFEPGLMVLDLGRGLGVHLHVVNTVNTRCTSWQRYQKIR